MSQSLRNSAILTEHGIFSSYRSYTIPSYWQCLYSNIIMS